MTSDDRTTTIEPDGAEALLLRAGDAAVARYVLRPDHPDVETPKPYLHPLRTLAGALVTGLRPDDHPWHHGLFVGMPRVGDHNLWGGGTYLGPDRGYEVLADQGRIEHLELDGDTGGDTVGHRLRWLGHGGEPLLEERRTLRVGATGRCWWLDLTSALTNVTEGRLPLETPAQRGRPDGGYGGLWLRLADGLVVEEVLADGGSTRESGVVSDRLVVRCRTAAGEAITLGLGHGEGWPTDRRHWVLRLDDFPALGWAPAYESGLALEPGGTLTLRYRLVVLDGAPDAADVTALLDRG